MSCEAYPESNYGEVVSHEFQEPVDRVNQMCIEAGDWHHRLGCCQIRKVQPQLRLRAGQQSQNVYDPVVVSIGPYHHGKPELRYAEEFKHVCLDWCARDSKPLKDAYYKIILEKINEIRQCYPEDAKAEEHDDRTLAKMIVQTRTPSTQDSPIARDGQESVDQPVIINLSGEALAAYSEAYEEFTKVSESDEEVLKIGFENGCHVQNGHMDWPSASDRNQETVFDRRTEEDLYSLSNDIVCSSSRDEVEDGEDEMEKLLIRQIIKKAKQGSPAVLKAQRAVLLSTDVNEH